MKSKGVNGQQMCFNFHEDPCKKSSLRRHTEFENMPSKDNFTYSV